MHISEALKNKFENEKSFYVTNRSSKPQPDAAIGIPKKIEK